MTVGTSLEKSFKVTHADTAQMIGSGNLHVLSTPIMIAWMENTAMTLIIDALPQGYTSVGTSIQVNHLKASAVDERVTCCATITAVEGRKVVFDITCRNEEGLLLGEATHERFIVNSEHFMAKLEKK